MESLLKKSIIFILIGIAVSGCRKESDRTTWNIDALAPLVYTTLTIDNLVPDSLLAYDENEVVFLSFSDTVLHFGLDTLIRLPDTSLVESFSIPFTFPQPLPPGTTLLPQSLNEIEINSADVELKKAKLRKGSIVVDIVSNFQGAVLCTYTIPDATLNGIPLTVQQLIQGSTDTSTTFQLTLDVSNYWVDFSNGSEPFNHLPTLLTIVADPNGEPLPVSAGDGVEITSTFTGLEPSYAEGYFGQQVVNTGVETQEINAFNLITSGSIDLDEVNVNLRILNGFGVDVRATIYQFAAGNDELGTSISLNHSVIGTPVNLNRATQPNGYPVPSVYDISLDNINSDIDQMLESFPDAIQIEADLELNPLGNISNHHDFAYAESSVSGILDVDIPLCLIANELVLSDTTDFSAGDALDNVNSGTLVIKINNGFPLEGKIWLETLDADFNSNSLLNYGTFSSGITNAENVVISSTYSEIHVTVDEAGIDQLLHSEKLVIKAQLSTSSLSEHVKMYRHYSIDAKVIADFNYHVND